MPELPTEKERKMKSLKRRLENWRELLVSLYSVLMWSKPWYPALIVGTITLIFLIHWFINPPFLASISLLILMFNLLDLLIPKVVHTLCPPQQWTASKEKTYEVVCEAIVNIQDNVNGLKLYMENLKVSQPVTHITYVVMGCIIMTWLSCTVNNWILLYILATTLALCPGIKHNQVVDKFAYEFFSVVSGRLRSLNQGEKMKIS